MACTCAARSGANRGLKEANAHVRRCSDGCTHRTARRWRLCRGCLGGSPARSADGTAQEVDGTAEQVRRKVKKRTRSHTSGKRDRANKSRFREGVQMSKKPIVLAIAGVLASGILALAHGPAAAAPGMGMALPSGSATGRSLIEQVDARSYNHCHNMPRRTRCHRKSRLPVNWPPNTKTPGTASLHEQPAKRARGCAKGDWFCWR